MSTIDAEWLTAWNHRGHELGTCMSLRHGDHVYVNVPKNASSWAKNVLLDQGWEFYNYHRDDQVQGRPALVILRDPMERWISGMAEYLAVYHAGLELHQSLWPLIADRVVFDDHTEKQIVFLHGLDQDTCVWFWHDHDLGHVFTQYLAVLNHIGPQHVSDQCPTRSSIKRWLRLNLQNDLKSAEHIRQYYAADQRLIDSVRFHATR